MLCGSNMTRVLKTRNLSLYLDKRTQLNAISYLLIVYIFVECSLLSAAGGAAAQGAVPAQEAGGPGERAAAAAAGTGISGTE